jgi:hypothetical protein
MLTTRSQLRVYFDALRVLFDHGNPSAIGGVEEVIGALLPRELALKGKVEALIAMKDWIELEANLASSPSSRDCATTLTDYRQEALGVSAPDYILTDQKASTEQLSIRVRPWRPDVVSEKCSHGIRQTTDIRSWTVSGKKRMACI